MTPAQVIEGAIEAAARADARRFGGDPEAHFSMQYGGPQYDANGEPLPFWKTRVAEIAVPVYAALAHAALALLLDARKAAEPGKDFEDILDAPPAAAPPPASEAA
jgi:hypothetical protein